MSKLPTYKGYTVDERLGEFRRVKWGKELQYIPFDSPKGRRLLENWKEHQHLKLSKKVARELKKRYGKRVKSTPGLIMVERGGDST